jgi:uncharacterized membrane protein YgcG
LACLPYSFPDGSASNISVLHLLIALQAVQIPPAPRGYGTNAAEIVVDAAGVLPATSVDHINRIAFDVHQKSGGEMAVVTLADIGLRAPVDVALAIGRAWKVGANAAIGQRTRNAASSSCSFRKRRARVDVASASSPRAGHRGLHHRCGSRIDVREAVPYFQQREYGPAMELVASRVAEQFAQEFGFTLDSSSGLAPGMQPDLQPAPRRGRGGGLSPFTIFILFIVAYFILSSLSRGRRGGCGAVVASDPDRFPDRRWISPRGWGGGWRWRVRRWRRGWLRRLWWRWRL